ncbi:MAG TPA: PEGA domain-containing protein [Polyangia bacterium]|nr:PEGA domain-containing protein [Polyangia bacterium]
MRIPILGVTLLACVLSAPASHAEETDPRAEAAAHYARGLELANQGQYQQALDEFNAAYAASPHFAVLYNVGQAEMALGRPIEAIAALTRYLRDGADKVPLSRREQVQAQIALLDAKLAELTITTNRAGATIRVDEREIGRTPLFEPVRLPAGVHTVTALLPDGAQATRSVTLAEADRQKLEIVLIAAAAAMPAAPAPASAPPPPDGHLAPAPSRGERPGAVTLRRAAIGATSAGVLLAGAAVGVYLWNRGRYEDWQNANAALEQAPSGTSIYHQAAIANNQLADSLTTANHAILGLSLAAGALVATGATLYLVDRAHRRRSGELAIDWRRDAAGGRTMAFAWSIGW